MATLCLLCCMCFVSIAIPAYEYVDPNAAGLISLTPLLVIPGAGLTFFRKQVGALFSGLSRRLRRGTDVEEL